MTGGVNIFITGMLESCMPDILRLFEDNTFAMPDIGLDGIRQINVDLLNTLNSYWDKPDLQIISQAASFHIPTASADAIESVFARNNSGKHLLLVDVLFCLTADHWLTRQKSDLFIVWVCNPLITADILAEQYGMPYEEALQLWEMYYWNLLRIVSGRRAIFLSCETHKADSRRSLQRLSESLASYGVSLEIDESDRYWEKDSSVYLNNRSAKELKNWLSAEQFALWQKLEAFTEKSTHLQENNVSPKPVVAIKSGLWLIKNLEKTGRIKSLMKGLFLLRKSPAYFDSDYYLRHNPDVQVAGIDPLVHFLLKGWREHRDPNPQFDVAHYLADNPDIESAGLNPLLHYLDSGWREGRYSSLQERVDSISAMSGRELDPDVDPLILLYREGVLPKPARPMSKTIHFIRTEKKLVGMVTVIVPVYLADQEAVRVFDLLLESIKTSYPQELPLLRFIFIDDCSPLQEMKECFQRARLTARTDIQLYSNDVNQGFVRTINKGFELAKEKSDVVILNSDTEIHGSVFEILQDNCMRCQNIASVTPLSNRAVLSSMSSWPLGDDAVYDLPPVEIASIIENIGLESPNTYVPTGHGFCMYMSNQALTETGGFDEETFGSGYGEENDWSVRAIRKGYRHLISTECYVHHHESRSFGHDRKSALQKDNLELLTARYPFYAHWIQSYLREDPLKLHRKILQLFLLDPAKQKQRCKTICFVLHDSFKNPFGGVQHYVRQLIEEIQQKTAVEVMIVAPTALKSSWYELYLQQDGKNIVIDRIDHRSLIKVLSKLEERIDYVHLHSTYGVNELVLDWIQTTGKAKKIFTVHDYQLFCRNPFLLDDNDRFCLNLFERSCADKRCSASEGGDLLQWFDTVFVPSENCRLNVQRLLDDRHKNIEPKVLPHFLSYIQEEGCCDYVEKSGDGKTVVFLGALYPHKGGEKFLEAVPELKQAGCLPMIWGTVQDELVQKFKELPAVIPFSNHKDLLELYALYGADVIVMPSICAETFSYTLYESLFLLESPVVVGEYGHPADIVKQYGVGEIVSDSGGITQSVNLILSDIKKYKRRIETFKQAVAHLHRPGSYIRNYFSFIGYDNVEWDSQRKKEKIHYFNKAASENARRIYACAVAETSRKLNRVLIIHGLSAENPPYFYRVENPTYFLEKSGCKVVKASRDELDTAMLENIDILYLSRTPMDDKLKSFLIRAKEKGIATVLDVDDCIFHSSFHQELYFLQDNEKQNLQYREVLSAMEETFNMVDVLFGSTPEIAEAGESLGKTSVYFRNRLLQKHRHLYCSLFEKRPTFKKKVIGYFSGSNTHDLDFLSIVNVLEEVFDVFPDAELLLMGFVGKSEFVKKHEARITLLPFGTYEDYLRAIQQCKVVLAPLAQINRFSNAKSNIKFLEAASVGTPVIASPCREMVACIEHGVNGWIAGTASQWQDAIKESFFEDYGEYVGAVANSYAWSHYGDASESFYKLLQALQDTRYGA